MNVYLVDNAVAVNFGTGSFFILDERGCVESRFTLPVGARVLITEDEAPSDYETGYDDGYADARTEAISAVESIG